MIGDVRFALRALARDRRFACVVIVTLAVGVAVNTTAFTLLSSLALRPLPAPHADRVVRVFPVDDRGERQNLFSYRDYLDYRAQTPGIEALAAYVPVMVALGGRAHDEPPTETLAYAVSAEYFTVLGMQPAAGRTIAAHDELPGAPRVALISHALWRRRFQGNATALGHTIDVNGRPFTIVGVAHEQFIGTEPLVPDVWVPLSAHDVVAPGTDVFDNRDTGWLLVIARLREGVSRGKARGALSVVAKRLAATYPSPHRPADIAITRGTFFSIEPRVWPIIVVVMAVAALVLLIACANVANLTLARAASRQRELAIRLAIGATRTRVVRLLVVESLVLGAAGAAAGLLLSGWALRFLYPIGTRLVPFPAAAVLLDLTPDVRVFAYTFALAALSGTAIAVAPALQFSTTRISPALQEDAAMAGTTIRPSRIRHALVVLQVASCVVLLAGAGLLARAVQRSRTLDLGFTARNVVMATVDLERQGYSRARAAEFVSNLAARGSTLAGWRASAFTTHVPLTGGLRLVSVEANASGASTPTSRITAPVRYVTAEYFDVLRIPVVAGRTFTADELAGERAVALISEALARRFWPDGNALGQTVRTSARRAPAIVIGLVRDAAGSTLWQGKEMAIYFPADRTIDPRDLRFVVRVDGDASAAAAALRNAARQLDPMLAFSAIPLEDAVRLWILPSRIAATAAVVLAIVALLLASVGLYGVLAYNVTQRTREIGIRIALGAASRDVWRLVVRDGARLIALGLATGLVAAALTTRVLRGLLLDVSTLDPLTFAAVAVVLCFVGLAACYLPARRAARVEPLTALRT